ncbi:pyridoxamine 5'-phosphate oxidase family protein [Candidatus Woesearchaeota archaeon]|nr:pyridoxamine 5'-phosphate oxidase family protein [Candidatus Woesearchaeota archaeon]
MKTNILIQTSDTKESDKIIESFYDILESNYLLALSTIDLKNKQPHVCCVFYVFDKEFNLYIWTDPNSKHSNNIAKNSKVAVEIYDSHQKWGSLLKGLQILGTSKQISNKEVLSIGPLYLKRYIKASNIIKTLKDFNSKKLESQLYKIQINNVKLLDENRFGKESYKEFDVKKIVKN